MSTWFFVLGYNLTKTVHSNKNSARHLSFLCFNGQDNFYSSVSYLLGEPQVKLDDWFSDRTNFTAICFIRKCCCKSEDDLIRILQNCRQNTERELDSSIILEEFQSESAFSENVDVSKSEDDLIRILQDSLRITDSSIILEEFRSEFWSAVGFSCLLSR